MFRLAQYAIRGSHQAIKKTFLYTSKSDILNTFNRFDILIFSKDVRMYLSDGYQAFDKWDESLSTEILQKTNISSYENLSNTFELIYFFFKANC